MRMYERNYSIGVIDVRLRSECRAFMREYHSLYAPYACAECDPQGVNIELVPHRRYPWPRGPYTLRSTHAPDFVVRSRHEMLPHLEWYVNWQIIFTRDDYIQLHASSIELDGRAMILPGDPGSGKTTLTAGLLARGWSYLCDEFALIEPSRRTVHPYPRALCIKEASFDVVEGLGLPLRRKTPYQKPTKGRVGFLSPLDYDEAAVGRASPVAWVVFPTYIRGASPELRPITKSQAAYALARQCFNIRIDQQQVLHALAEVARGAECYELVAGEINSTCDLVESLIAPVASRKAG